MKDQLEIIEELELQTVRHMGTLAAAAIAVIATIVTSTKEITNPDELRLALLMFVLAVGSSAFHYVAFIIHLKNNKPIPRIIAGVTVYIGFFGGIIFLWRFAEKTL